MLDIRQQYEAEKEARERRAQEAAPKPWWWLGQRDPIARFTKWLVAWTALLFIATIINALILANTDRTLQNTLEANNRAWLAVVAASLGSTPVLNLPILAHITYKNTGQSPTVKINYMMYVQQVAVEKDGSFTIPYDDTCARVPYPGNKTLFPGNDYVVSFPTGREAVMEDDAIKNKIIYVWRGCFRYETYRKERYTQFCFYLRGEAPRWYWQECGINAE